MKPRIVFMGSPGFAATVLQHLLDAKAEVVATVCQPDRPAGRGNRLRAPEAKRCAQAASIEVLQPTRVRDGELSRWLSESRIDLVVVAAYGRILGEDVLRAPRLGCVNVHASLLPRWRGASPIQRAIAAGDAETGVTLMQMDAGMDTGATLATARTEITTLDTAEILEARLAELGGRLLVDQLPALCAGGLSAVPQPQDGASLAPLLHKDEGRIDWSRTATDLHAHLRAMWPWPCAWRENAATGGERWRFFPIGLDLSAGRGVPGEVLEIERGAAWIATGEGALRIGEAQRPGKRRMTAADVLAGARIGPGDRLD